MNILSKPSFSSLVTRLANGELVIVIPFLALLIGFYALTSAGNLSETDDVYAFAYRAENFAISHISDPRLMLYHMAMRTLYLACSAVGLDVSALTTMRAFSALCAAFSLFLLLRILKLNFSLSPATSIAGVAILALSYGFWRYAAEAEVYIPAIMLCLLIFHLLLQLMDRPPSNSRFTLIGVLAGLAVLFYQPNVIPLLFAFPLLMLTKARFVSLVLYLSAAGSTIGLGYLIGYLIYWPDPISTQSLMAFLSQRSNEFMVPPLSLKTIIVSMVRSAFALTHDFVSANWIFGLEPAVLLINKAFSNNVVVEEIFLARRAGFLVYLPILTLLPLVWVVYRIAVTAWPLPLKTCINRPCLAVVVWTVLYAAVVGRLNPAGIEAWIMALPPLIILLAILVLENCIKLDKHRIVAILVTLIFFHNAMGGMALVTNPANEYDRVKGEWAIENASEHDLIIVTDNAGLAESLRYLSNANVALLRSFDAANISTILLGDAPQFVRAKTYGRDFGGQSLRDMVAATHAAGGRIILFDNFFTNRKLFSGSHTELPKPMRDLKERSSLVYQSADAGATYVLDKTH